MFSIPYRWTFRNLFPNIHSMWCDLYYGIGNIFKWMPIIWFDRDWDWAFLAEMMEYKFTNMAKLFKSYGHHIGSEKDATRMMICAELLKRLRTESYTCFNNGLPITKANILKEEVIAKYYQEYVGKLIGKYLRRWWD